MGFEAFYKWGDLLVLGNPMGLWAKKEATVRPHWASCFFFLIGIHPLCHGRKIQVSEIYYQSKMLSGQIPNISQNIQPFPAQFLHLGTCETDLID